MFRTKPFTAEDIRFTQSKDGKTLYAIVLAFPADGKVTIKSLAENSAQWPGKIGSVRLLGPGGGRKTQPTQPPPDPHTGEGSRRIGIGCGGKVKLLFPVFRRGRKKKKIG